ncbi:MAG: glutamate--tRNA ligase [Parvibaculales bacterium]
MSSDTKIVTRFAPSPSGFLHIGGARTALFNWAFARHYGGQFLLRIEDTDRKRSTDEAIAAILDGMDWLGLEYDNTPIYQHKNTARHTEIAKKLLASGHAYKCYCTPQELEAMREAARAANQPVRYDGRCRNRTDTPPDTDFVVRFKAPQTGHIIIDDKVQGAVRFANDQMDDLILLRSDGTPTYMLSVVVDDYDMGISHIIRGDDHLTNAARQAQIYEALGWPLPIFAHIPLIHGADGAKLSKRHGALGVAAYREMGYLPSAMRNYLARLGWSHGNDEIFATQQFIDWFGLEAIGRAPARFDIEKLNHVNAQHISMSDDDELVDIVVEQDPALESMRDKLRLAMPNLKSRAKKLGELNDRVDFLNFTRPLQIEEKAAKLLTDETRQKLADLLPTLEKLDSWTAEEIETAIRDFLAANDLKMGDIAPALRAALTGKTQSVGVFLNLALLQKSEALARITDQLG